MNPIDQRALDSMSVAPDDIDGADVPAGLGNPRQDARLVVDEDGERVALGGFGLDMHFAFLPSRLWEGPGVRLPGL